ncbi:hypothetical protein ABWH92_12170 [Ahrensia marina]|uniref:hypothetical protein n=1 Tax=Ahrensia marina TaxID=1514904 RepID=UPI0035D111AA
MGHYRSEMVSQSDIEAEERRKSLEKADLVAGLEQELKGKSLAEVLAQMIDDREIWSGARHFRSIGRQARERILIAQQEADNE